MRNSFESPFMPGSDTVPAVWAGRREYLNDWHQVVRARRMAGSPETARTILGEPGTGKSSLVRKIAQEAELQGDWATSHIRIPFGADPLKLLATELLALAQRVGLGARVSSNIKRVLSRVEEISAYGISLSLASSGGEEPSVPLRDLLIELGRRARKKNKMLLVHLDEVHNIRDDAMCSQLLVALGDALVFQEPPASGNGAIVGPALPIAVYLTGLPEFAEMTGAHNGATFARSFRLHLLGGIDDNDLDQALHPFVAEGWALPSVDGSGERRVFMSQQASRRMLELVCGEPYLFQLAGYQAWIAGSSSVITEEDVLRGWAAMEAEAELHVTRLLENLPEKELLFLQTMADLPPEDRKPKAIAKAMGYASSSRIGTFSQRLDIGRRLIDRGMRRGGPYTFRNRAVEAYLTTSWPQIAD